MCAAREHTRTPVCACVPSVRALCACALCVRAWCMHACVRATFVVKRLWTHLNHRFITSLGKPTMITKSANQVGNFVRKKKSTSISNGVGSRLRSCPDFVLTEQLRASRAGYEDPDSDAEEEYVKLCCGGTEVLSRPWTDSSQGQVVFVCLNDVQLCRHT